jgi:hypothetical protein
MMAAKNSRLILWIVASVAAVVVIALLVALASVNTIARNAVEVGGKTALGVKTKLDGANVGVFDGDVTLSGLLVSNPDGFSTPHFLAMKQGRLRVTIDSLLNETVEAPLLEFSGIDVNLERSSAGANYQIILDHSKSSSGSPASKGEGSKKKFIIGELVIRDVTVHAALLPGGKMTAITLNIPEIRLKDVGSHTTGGVMIQELWPILTQAILSAASEKLANDLPKDVGQSLARAVEQAKKAAGKDGGSQLLNDAGAVIQGLGGLLGGDKERK